MMGKGSGILALGIKKQISESTDFSSAPIMDEIAKKQHPTKTPDTEIMAGNHSDTRTSFSRCAVKLCSKLS